MRKQLLLYIMMTLSIQGLSAFDNRKFFNLKSQEAQKSEASQWAFFEQTFIIDLHAEKQAIWNYIHTALPASIALFAGYQYLTPENPANYVPKPIKTETTTD